MCCCSNPFYDIKKSAIIFFILLDFFTKIHRRYMAGTLPIWRKTLSNQLINQSEKYILVIKILTYWWIRVAHSKTDWFKRCIATSQPFYVGQILRYFRMFQKAFLKRWNKSLKNGRAADVGVLTVSLCMEIRYDSTKKH